MTENKPIIPDEIVSPDDVIDRNHKNIPIESIIEYASKGLNLGEPEDVPGTCGALAIEFRDQHGLWKGVIKPGFTKKQAKEEHAVNAIVRHLGSLEVSRLNIVLIQRFCTDVMQKDNVKPSTVNQYCSVLRLMLEMAVQEKVIDTNPMQGFKRVKDRRIIQKGINE